MNRALVLSVLACAGAGAAAEPAPVVPEGRRLSPRQDVVLSSYSTTHSDELTTRDLRLKAAVPLVRGDGYGAALLLGYDATWFEIPTVSGEDHLALHRTDATVGGGFGIAPRWSLRGSIGMSYASDLQEAAWDAVHVTTSAMTQHVLGPADAVVVGVVYSSTSELFPVLPLFGYVHQREGSRFRFDALLPHHVRAEYELRPRLRGAVGLEVSGDTWALQQSRSSARRAGGAVFGELGFLATRMIHVELRAGVSVAQYTLPMALDGMLHDQPLRAAGFGQLAVIVAP